MQHPDPNVAPRPTGWVLARPYAIALFVAATFAGYVALGLAVAKAPSLTNIGLTPGPDGRPISVLSVFAGVGCSVLGGLVAARRPRHPIGWLLLGIGAGWWLIDGSSYLAYTNRLHPSVVSNVALVLWAPLVAIFGSMVVLLLAMFPSGLVRTGWRRWALAVGGAALAADVAACSIQTRLKPSGTKLFVNPIGVPGAQGAVKIALSIAPFVIVLLAFVMAFDVVVRWRRSRALERQQMKFLGYALLIELPLLVILVVVIPDSNGWAAWFFAALNGFAVAIGLAVNRFRLYDIDRLMSRTLSYAFVTGLVVGTYVGIITLTTKVLGFSSPVAVAASTLMAVALFNPLRRRLQHVVDRRFNRARYDAEATVAAFTARLRDAVDMESVRVELLEAVNRAVEPAHASVWIRRRG